ncbi:hypothetical protein [Flavihumibacter sp. UBA7668]|uniref:hypothetical protein n=1 Tax=Flavihumibacter sp. UBA7668 TaxID=1946542 RepID=UPI0025BFA40E|nr:hypothetical protein [Flavihumibacter sp. UBA7668]
MDKHFRINQVLERYFQQHPKSGRIMAKDLMPTFIREGVFSKDDQNGLPIRNVLRELDKKKQLHKIPYVIADRKAVNTNWFFAPVNRSKQPTESLPENVDLKTTSSPNNRTKKSRTNPRNHSDEHYIIDLCDEVAGVKALRQHNFSFLLGDPGIRGNRAALPVDAWYESLNLVVEYHERQHSEAVRVFDKRSTVSGVSRGEQRKIYDQRRISVLDENKIALVILSVNEFDHDSSKRLRRNREKDLATVRCKLTPFIKERNKDADY